MTSAQRLEALKDAYYSGQRRVKLDGQEIEYQSMSDMWTAIRRLEAEISPSSRQPVVSMRPTMYNRGRR